MPWLWRRRWDSPKWPGVFVELLEGGWLVIYPAPDDLSPSEFTWAEQAQAELWIEWLESGRERWLESGGRT